MLILTNTLTGSVRLEHLISFFKCELVYRNTELVVDLGVSMFICIVTGSTGTTKALNTGLVLL